MSVDETNLRNIKRVELGDEDDASAWEKAAVFITLFFVIITFPISIFFCLTWVKEYERVVILRFGRLRKGGARTPGVLFYLPCIDELINLDLRLTPFNVFPQDALTKDSMTVRVDAVVFYRIEDPIRSVVEVGDHKLSTLMLAQTNLRNIIGTKTLYELLSERPKISGMVQKLLAKQANFWGVKVERVDLKDISIPLSMQRSMAVEAGAKREAKAKKIAADGERKAADALKAASDIISSNTTAIQVFSKALSQTHRVKERATMLRYLHTLIMIATSNKVSAVILPIPGEFMKMCLNWATRPCSCDI